MPREVNVLGAAPPAQAGKMQHSCVRAHGRRTLEGAAHRLARFGRERRLLALVCNLGPCQPPRRPVLRSHAWLELTGASQKAPPSPHPPPGVRSSSGTCTYVVERGKLELEPKLFPAQIGVWVLGQWVYPPDLPGRHLSWWRRFGSSRLQSRSVDPDWQRLGHSGHHYGPKVCKGWCAGSSTGSCMMCVACCCRRAASELPIRVAKRATQVTAVAHCAALARSRGTSRPRPHAERWLPSKMSADACIFHEERGSCRPAPGGDGDWMKTFFGVN